jgi:hypothetical protein
MKKQNSFVLIFSITILSLVMILTFQLLRLVSVGIHFDRTMIDRERAEMLALGGINLAISQLTLEKPTEEKEEAKKKVFTAFLKRVLPNLNRWQAFKLDEQLDGIEGEIKICIGCENGKININEIYDFKKDEFKPEYKKFLEGISFKGEVKTKESFVTLLAELLKKRHKRVDDISELQAHLPAQISQLFYTPPLPSAKPQEDKPNDSIALQDIFTIFSNNEKLEALFLSDALCSILGFRRPKAHDALLRDETFQKIIKEYKPELDQNTEDYWKIIKPLYEQKDTFKIENTKIFCSKFEPTTYSVLSSGKVGTVEQRIVAILEKQEPEPKEPDKQKKHTPEFKVTRLYWI